mmetsp:Transcript_1125/g.2923  ORF Transcript_1125/g.2923 Transcript_1125/m.2923 type:complete len:212 (-) Transcript_1125:70-705(-)
MAALVALSTAFTSTFRFKRYSTMALLPPLTACIKAVFPCMSLPLRSAAEAERPPPAPSTTRLKAARSPPAAASTIFFVCMYLLPKPPPPKPPPSPTPKLLLRPLALRLLRDAELSDKPPPMPCLHIAALSEAAEPVDAVLVVLFVSQPSPAARMVTIDEAEPLFLSTGLAPVGLPLSKLLKLDCFSSPLPPAEPTRPSAMVAGEFPLGRRP